MVRMSRELESEADFGSFARRALIVDEDVKDLANHASLLEALGFEVEKCQSYEGAIRLIEKDLFDLVLVTEGPGFEAHVVLRYLNRYLPYTRSLVLARRADARSRLHALELGADDYVVKPSSADQMYEAFRKVLGVPANA